jgi:hypothetical protein
MLGGDLHHSLAPEVFLKPVLVELGDSCPTPGLFLLETITPVRLSWNPGWNGRSPYWRRGRRRSDDLDRDLGAALLRRVYGTFPTGVAALAALIDSNPKGSPSARSRQFPSTRRWCWSASPTPPRHGRR